MTVKVCIFEEHNEAFALWNYACKEGLIGEEGNSLVHIDEHSDAGSPQMNVSLHELNGDTAKVNEFTHSELNIASFIVPALYQGLFDKVYWIRHGDSNFRQQSYKRVVFSHLGMGKRLYFSERNESMGNADDEREITINLRSVTQITEVENPVLDIDLDFFSSIDNPNLVEPLAIAITEEEFNEFQNKRYHPVRYRLLGHRVQAVESDGQYFYLLDGYEDAYPMRRRVDEKTIEERINALVEQLSFKRIETQFIGVCRSKHSGYTPRDQCEFIQEKLLAGLDSLYETETYSLDEILVV